MAIKTAGIVNITIQFESNSAQGFGKFSEGVQDETRLLIDRLTALGVRGVEVVDSDVLVGQNFVLVDGTNGQSAAEPEEVEQQPTEAPKRRGRPPKAKATADVQVGTEEAAPKRRGRPPGSKNKPKVAAEVSPTPAPKRGPKLPKRRA